MDLSIRPKNIYSVKHRYAILLKFGDIFLTSLTNLVMEAKSSICSAIKENLLLYRFTFSVFAVFVIIQHIL